MFTLTVIDKEGDVDVYFYEAADEQALLSAVSKFHDCGYQTSYYFEDCR